MAMSFKLNLLQRVGVKLAKRRKEIGLKQSDVASALGVSTAFVSQLETGKKPVPENLIAGISQVLDFDLMGLLQCRDFKELKDSNEVSISTLQAMLDLFKDLSEEDQAMLLEFMKGFKLCSLETKKTLINKIHWDLELKVLRKDMDTLHELVSAADSENIRTKESA
jgi:transcriptional regulator with XRE-family HTH domain